jgi:glucosamine 6-phosphate synthetase-like amidotransferase/phosphosugar isomerase protein
MGSRVIVIGQEGDTEAQRVARIFFEMPPVSEPLPPFVYKLPFEYLACHIADRQDIAFLNFDNPKRLDVNFRQIFHSAQQSSAEGSEDRLL